MANAVASSPANGYATFFERRVVQSIRRWQTFVAENQADTAALGQRQVRILRAISFALSFETAWPAARHLIEAFAPYMERRGYWDTWRDILTQAVEAAQRFGDTAGQVTLMALLARLLQRQSRFHEAIRLYRRVIRLARRTGHRFEEARACSNLGFLYIDGVGRWQRAEALCCHALTIFEALDSDHGRAHTENHLGVLYTRQHAWKRAKRHFNRACALWEKMGDDHSLIYGFENLGMLYYEMANPTQALAYLEKAFHQAQLTEEEAELGTIWTNIGIAYQQNGDLIKAEFYARQAEKIFHRFSNSLGLAQVWDNLGVVCLEQGKGEDAIRYLESSLNTYRLLNNWDGEIKSLMNIVQYELTRENLAQAVSCLNEAERLIMQYTQGKQKNSLDARLKKYRRRLTMLET